jgi:nicotinate phosphoribosyltransferase
MEMKEQDEIYRLLSTDYYELTMAKGYLDSRMENDTATFDLFIRSLPENWGFFIANGIEDAVDFLIQDFFFRPEDISYLRDQGFPEYFLDCCKDIKFTGDVWAVPEGTPVAPNTTILRVTSPLIQAQLAETALLNLVNFPTLIATKANRIARAASGAPVVDFGLRRAQGPNAGLKGARAAFIGGCRGTSNVEAGRRYGIPVSGTQAHSWVMVFPQEIDAFRAYADSFPDNVTLLIDTYDVLQGARNAAVVAKEMEAAGHRLDAVRIDSGDLADLSFEVRAILDGEGLDYVKIVATSDLNEYKIEDLVARKARIDSYGVGTELITGKPVAALPGVYKLVNIDDRPVIKLSSAKMTYPGIKQVYRLTDDTGNYKEDLLALEHEKVEGCSGGESRDGALGNDLNAVPLLGQVISRGERVVARRSIHETKIYVEECVSKMPRQSLKIGAPSPYLSRPSRKLCELMRLLRCKYAQDRAELA